MSRPVYAWLAAMAAAEVASREKHYPAMVDRGELTRDDADADLAAWRVIAELFEKGETRTFVTWAELELAAARALIRREEAVKRAEGEAAPPDRLAALIQRREAIQAIHARIAMHRELFATPVIASGAKQSSATEAAA